MALPILNVVVFVVLQSISIGGLLSVLVCFTLRHYEVTKSANTRRFLRQLLLFGHGLVYQVAQTFFFFGVGNFDGATVAQLEGIRAPAVAVSLLAAMGCLLLFLSMAAKVIIPDARRPIDITASFLYMCALSSHVVMGILFPPDHLRIRAWSYLSMCIVFFMASFVAMYLIYRNVRLLYEMRRSSQPPRSDLSASLRNMLIGLLLALAITVGWIINFFRAPQVYSAYQGLLFVSTPPTDPIYTALVADPLLSMDLGSATFLYPLIGTAASYPHLLSPGNVNWVRERMKSYFMPRNSPTPGTPILSLSLELLDKKGQM